MSRRSSSEAVRKELSIAGISRERAQSGRQRGPAPFAFARREYENGL